MKIALVAPYSLFFKNSQLSEDGRLNELIKTRGSYAKAYSPCESLLQLAALTPSSHELIYMDDQYNNIDASHHVDIAAISIVTVSADRAYAIADEFRRNGVYVIVGGIHATLCPEDALKHADTVVIGDADDVWPSFLLDYENKRTQRIYNGGCTNIKKTPSPQISLLSKDRFYRPSFQKEQYSLRCSSGCTRRCKYCSDWAKPGCGRYQKKTIAQIRNELEQIMNYSDNFYLLISDDNLFLDLKYGKNVLQIIRDMKIRWYAPSDISISDDPQLLGLIKDSGCIFLLLGLESLDERNLKWLAPWKAKRVNNYRQDIKKIRDAGINVMGSFMVGMDHDTPTTFQEYFDFFMETELSGAAAAILTPYPGTQFRDKLIVEGRLNLNARWESYSSYNLLYDHPTLSKKDAYDGMLWFIQQCESPDVIEHIKRITIR